MLRETSGDNAREAATGIPKMSAPHQVAEGVLGAGEPEIG